MRVLGGKRSSKTLLPTAGPCSHGAGGRRNGGAELCLSYGTKEPMFFAVDSSFKSF